MKVDRIRWTEDRISHIAKHQLSSDEVEEAIFGDPSGFNEQLGRAERNPEERIYRYLGRTDSGRYITVIFIAEAPGRIFIVTARDMDPRERKRYRAKIH